MTDQLHQEDLIRCSCHLREVYALSELATGATLRGVWRVRREGGRDAD